MIYEAIQKIEKAGFTLKECGGLLSVEPSSLLSDIQRQWINKHKEVIVRQLQGLKVDDHLHLLIHTFQADVMKIRVMDGSRNVRT